MRRILLSLVLLAICPIGLAGHFWQHHADGWHWYQAFTWMKPKKTLSSKQLVDADPVATMSAIQKSIQRSLDKAILHPSKANIKRYIVLQNALSAQSTQFSDQWQQVLLENPALNYRLTHPVNHLGSTLYQELKQAHMHDAVNQFRAHLGLFFFYRGNCPYCHRFAPILKQFSDLTHIVVLPITLDGQVLKEFPQSVRNNGAAETFQVSRVPAIFAVDPKTGATYPLGYGLMSMQTLQMQMVRLMHKLYPKEVAGEV